METIRAYSHPKLNLRLKVTGRRSNGYHELSMLNVMLEVSDQLEIDFSSRNGVRLSVSGKEASGIPVDDTNLVVKACKDYFNAVGEEFGLEIRLKKNIPAGSGCGGGSSNAASILKILQAKATNPLSENALSRIAQNLGADVPYFLGNGSAWAGGIGDKTVFQSVPYLVELPCMLIVGLPHSSTPEVFQLFREEGQVAPDSVNSFPESYSELLSELDNDLEPAARKLCPMLGELIDGLSSKIGQRVGMTGSGSGLFVLPKTLEGFSGSEVEFVKEHSARMGGRVIQTTTVTD